MAERLANGSPYGQFGRATYDEDDKKWRFERSLSLQTTFRILEEPTGVIPPSLQHFPSEPIPDGKEGPSRRREKQAQALVQSFPEIQPVCGLLPELARVSEAIEDALGHHDPTKGSLLAFGEIPDQRTREPAQVAAFPSGPTGNKLRILQVQDQARGWKDSKTTWLSVPVLHGEEALWTGPGAPIQSIDCIQSSDQGGAFLIVRLLAETVIFRPMLRKTASEMSSRLDINLVYRLPLDPNDGAPHAYVFLNPWNSKQFAVVDQAGSWSVNEFRSAGTTSYKERLSSNRFSESDEMQLQPMYDGWARILWMGKSNSIVVCSRNQLFMCDITDASPRQFPKITSHLQDGLGWNLDLILIPSHDHHLILLTSDHIIVYHAGPEQFGEYLPKIIACTRHYRNAGDSSMRLHIFQEDADTFLSVSSASNQMILLYQIEFFDNGQISVSDPAEVLLPPSSGGTLDFRIESTPMNRRRNIRSDQSMGSHYAERSIRFYSITILHRDLSISQSLYYAEPNGQKSQVRVPVWNGQLPKSSKILPAEDFVVDDDTDSVIDQISHERKEPVSDFIQHHQDHMSLAMRREWTMNYERITARLEGDAERADARDIAQAAQKILQDNTVDRVPPFCIVRDLGEGEITFDNAEEVTEALGSLSILDPASQALTEEIEANEMLPNRVISRRVTMPTSFHLPALEDMAAVQNYVTENWVSPLSEDLSPITRTAKDQLARQVASELILSSHILRLERPVAPIENVKESQTQSQSQQSNPPSSHTTPSLYFDASSQPQSPAYQSASATSSTITTSSHPSTFSGPEIARLRAYTSISKPPPSLPRSLTKVLSHWQPGTDPSTYDWRSTARRTAREDEEAADAQLPEKERRRLQRRTERYVRRQRREAEESRRQQMLSTQAPEIVSASQPSQDVRGGKNLATPMLSSQMVASQVLEGRHGGRKPVRKKRKSGF